MRNPQETAETLALQVLAWLVGDEDLMPVFQGSTGVSEADIRERATDPQFLGAVLDFLMMDDAWVMRFCDAHNLPYERIMQMRGALPGGEQVNWT
ncbi:DUF3572 domain-containing protein [Sulfitobacter sp. F26204]|uniref:DUF3572 domain-containing protein n=1 Tax=Sulfitobacter sp. F26204 TaxID=2996014 RepID=UPI00225E1E6A|nr:DUF3572 domain-containing protein [Sulfitobacter sp. F26204]MCX7559214.1 DUF3572 domain-containing protein [Sulfitobacter sp. F26204]